MGLQKSGFIWELATNAPYCAAKLAKIALLELIGVVKQIWAANIFKNSSIYMNKVLITGASGLIGSRLTEMLLEQGAKVVHLSRYPKKKGNVTAYGWSLSDGYIDLNAFDGVDGIVHLAGAGIADHRWTADYKRQIVDSRTKSAALLIDALQKIPGGHGVKCFVGASAVGYYGNRGDELLTEDSGAQPDDFLSQTTQLWEQSYLPLNAMPHIRKVVLRIGIVLSAKGGALPKTDLPIRMGAPGAFFGSGKQFYPWIHIDDLCRLFITALSNEAMSGVYNAVAPMPVTNEVFTKTIAQALGRWQIALPAPEFALRLLMGQMADIVLHSANVSAQKAEAAGFKFLYPNLLHALKQLYGR